MIAVPKFYRSATPTRDYMPISGIDHEFMRFLRLRRSAAASRSAAPMSVHVEAVADTTGERA